MKKILLLFALCALAACEPMSDYRSEWQFVVVNETDFEIIIEQNADTKILPVGDRQTISVISDLGGKDNIPEDRFEADEVMRLTNSPHATVRLSVDGEVVSDKIFTRKYWDFTSKRYLATYTLTVTNELLAHFAHQSDRPDQPPRYIPSALS